MRFLIVLLIVSAASNAAIAAKLKEVVNGQTVILDDGTRVRIRGIKNGDPEKLETMLEDRELALARVKPLDWGSVMARISMDGKYCAAKTMIKRGWAEYDSDTVPEGLSASYRLSVPGEEADFGTEVVYYSMPGCLPCQRMMVHYQSVRTELAGVETWSWRETNQRTRETLLAGITTYPTLVVRRNGIEVARLIGEHDAVGIRSFLGKWRAPQRRVRRQLRHMNLGVGTLRTPVRQRV